MLCVFSELEEVMKAVLALVVIYVGMFLVAIQGSSPTSVQAAAQGGGVQQNTVKANTPIDPAKDADIRALLELVGARDQVQDSVRQSAEQYRERLLATVPNNEKGQMFVNTTIDEYEKRYNIDRVNEQLIVLYNKHYSSEDIKGLLQFYGSPLGQKVAAESPKIFHEIQEATRAEAARAAKDALQEAKQENPGIGQNAHLGNPGTRRLAQPQQQHHSGSQDASQQSAQQQEQR
jgi:hypothetical protein